MEDNVQRTWIMSGMCSMLKPVRSSKIDVDCMSLEMDADTKKSCQVVYLIGDRLEACDNKGETKGVCEDGSVGVVASDAVRNLESVSKKRGAR